MMLRELDIHMQKNKFGSLPYAIYKNSKWIKGLNVRTKTIQLLKENGGKIIRTLGFGKDFLDVTPKA